MRDVAPAHGTNMSSLERRDCRGLAIEREELDLECLAALVNVNDDTHIPGLEAMLGERRR